MTVDPSIDDYQVIIIAHSRELINQITGIFNILLKGSQITVSIGEKGVTKKTHILVTSVGYIKNLLPTSGRGADKKVFSNVKMIVFDEADAVFAVETNLPDINNLIVVHL
jgi:superfamily II DNA/RNA helicase